MFGLVFLLVAFSVIFLGLSLDWIVFRLFLDFRIVSGLFWDWFRIGFGLVLDRFWIDFVF